jgi:hypothetical protein
MPTHNQIIARKQAQAEREAKAFRQFQDLWADGWWITTRYLYSSETKSTEFWIEMERSEPNDYVQDRIFRAAQPEDAIAAAHEQVCGEEGSKV